MRCINLKRVQDATIKLIKNLFFVIHGVIFR
jgi:hypothetical protein